MAAGGEGGEPGLVDELEEAGGRRAGRPGARVHPALPVRGLHQETEIDAGGLRGALDRGLDDPAYALDSHASRIEAAAAAIPAASPIG